MFTSLINKSKFLLLVFVLFFGISVGNVIAQTSSSTNSTVVANINLSNATILSQDGDKFLVSLDFVNDGNVPQSDIKYGIELIKKTEKGQTVKADTFVFDEILTVGAKETLHKEFTYTAPPFLSGGYEIWVIGRGTSGIMFGLGQAGKVILNLAKEYVEIFPESCYLKVKGDNKKYTLLQGVDVSKEEKLSISCLVKNHFSEDISISPMFKTYERTVYGEFVKMSPEDISGNTIKKGETKELIFSIPKPEKPQAYDVSLTLTRTGSTTTPVSSSVISHYVLRGESATIQNASLDKTSYEKGEIITANLFWTPSADQFPGSRATEGTNNGGVTLKVDILDESSIPCVDTVTKNIDKKEANTSITVTSLIKCDSPKISFALVDENGSTLDNRSFLSPKKETNKYSVYLEMFFGVLLLLLAIIFIRKKFFNTTKFLLLTIITSAIFFVGAGEVNALTYGIGGVTTTVNTNKSIYTAGESIVLSGSAEMIGCHNGAVNTVIITATLSGQSTVVGSGLFGVSNSTGYLTAPSTAGTYIISLVTTQTVDGVTSNAGTGSITITVISSPSVSLYASPTSIPYNSSANLSWSSVNATSCTAGGAWSGAKATSGSVSTGNLTSSQTYTLYCTGPGGNSTTKSVTVAVAPLSTLPTATLSASPASVAYGTASTLTWNSTNATSCTAGGAWSGAKATSGSVSTGNLTTTVTYTLYCTGLGGNSSTQSVTVTVGSGAVGTPTATLSANPTSVPYNTSSTLSWSSTGGATYCTAGGAWSGIKSNFAGTPVTVSTFATLPPTSYVMAIVFDSSGNLYTANYTANTVSKITPAGVVTTFTFVSTPRALAFDSSGNLYVANYGGNTIFKIAPSGASSAFATVGANPNALAFDSSGNLYVANYTGGTISKITPSGVVTTFATIGTALQGLVFDTAGNLYTANSANNAIYKITPSGVATLFATIGTFPMALVFDTSGNLYTANDQTNTVSKITPAGVVTTFATVGYSPYALVFDSSGNLYVANYHGDSSSFGSVYKITSAGVVTTLATFGNYPTALAFDAVGNLFVMRENIISRISPAGFDTGNLTSSQTYTLYCTGAGGNSTTKSVTVTVLQQPTATLSAASTNIPYNASTTLSWSSTNATYCTADGDWYGRKFPNAPVAGGITSTYYPYSSYIKGLTFSSTTNSIFLLIPFASAMTYLFKVNLSTGAESSVPVEFNNNPLMDIAIDSVTNSVWVTANETTQTYPAILVSGVLHKLDLDTMAWKASYQINSCSGVSQPPNNITFDSITNSVWVTNYCSNTVSKVNIYSGTKVNYAVNNSPYDLVFEPVTGSVWVSYMNSNTVSKVNVINGTKIDYADTSPGGLTFDPVTNSIWGVRGTSRVISKINVYNGTKVSYGTGTYPYSVAFDPVTSSVWVSDVDSSSVSKFDIYTGARTDYPIGFTPGNIAFDSYGNFYIAKLSSNGFVKFVVPISSFNTGNLTSSKTYTLYCTGPGGNSTTKSVTVNVGTNSTPPVATITTPAINISIPENQAQQFTGEATDADGTIVDYEWRVGNCTTGTLISSLISFVQSFITGTYNVYFRAQDNNGLWSLCDSRVVEVTLNNQIPGVCGSANGVARQTKPTTNLCSTVGLPGPVVLPIDISTLPESGTPSSWTWTCSGENGGASASCSSNTSCGDGLCQASKGENPSTCKVDCKISIFEF